MGRIRAHPEDAERRAQRLHGPQNWSPASYPRPDPLLVDDREKEVATERLLWRRDGSLACAAGKQYAIEDRPLMMTEPEFHQIGSELRPIVHPQPEKPKANPESRSQVIPNTPIANGLTEPLVSVAQYQSITGDTASGSDAVEEAIADAVYMICQECHRTLTYGTYKENLYLYALGMVFPSAAPIDHNQPISSGEQLYNPATDNQQGEGSIIQGAGIWVGWFTPLPWMPVWTGVIPPQTDIEYSGGFQPYQTADGPTPGLPPKLARAVATTAYYILHPVGIAGMPGGVKSSSVGGVSMSGDLSSFFIRDPNLKRVIRRFRRPQVRAWET